MKNKAKIVMIICILIMVFLSTFSYVLGADTDTPFKDADSFIKNGTDQGSTIDPQEMKDLSSLIYYLLLSIATVVAVAVGAILGIKYMLASVDDKANIKETMIPFIIGCVVVFGAFGIWKITVTIGSSIAY